MPGAAGVGQGSWPRVTKLPPRHLEPVLQALVRDGILKGIRGPHGGYELARERKKITAEDILRAASAVRTTTEEPQAPPPCRPWSATWYAPRWRKPSAAFRSRLAAINVEDMAGRAETRR